jgi:hypothetical protein
VHGSWNQRGKEMWPASMIELLQRKGLQFEIRKEKSNQKKNKIINKIKTK